MLDISNAAASGADVIAMLAIVSLTPGSDVFIIVGVSAETTGGGASGLESGGRGEGAGIVAPPGMLGIV